MAPRFDLIGIVTSDLAASLAFYRRLGIDIPEDSDDEPHVEATLPGGLRIAWDPVATIQSFDPDWTSPTGGHRLGLAFACDDPADVDATYASMTGAGAPGHLEPWDAFWGMRYAVLVDPDGNHVDLFAPLAATKSA
ncbi:MAG: VOC family protein [Acidimicrobiales bacterium]